MSKLGLVLVMVLILGRTNAQTYPAPDNEPPTYFVLIQADDGQAFYIRLDDQLYSSSPAGHLILARLKDSAYTITVGFPGQTYPERRYLLNIHQKDWAVRLTRQDGRWGLFDSQGQPVPTVADPGTTEKPMLAGMKKDDAFSQLMSAIVRDTAVMYNTYDAAPPDSNQPVALGPASTSALATTLAPTASAPTASAPATTTTPGTSAPATTKTIHDTSAAAASPIIHDNSGSPTSVPAVLSATVTTPDIHDSSISSRSPADTLWLHSAPPSSSTTNPAIPSAPTGVVKLSEHRSTQSLSLLYADHPADRKTDTIDVVIPVDSPIATALHPPSPDTSHSAISRHSRSPDTSRSTTTPRKSSLPFVNSDCHAFATDYDVDKLRVRMLNATRDDERIQTADKVFRTKCFTTRQVRALSEVFTTDPAKFKFLATAYPFVSDDNFPELVNLLSDPVYAERFRTMTGRH